MKPIKGNTNLIKAYRSFIDSWNITGNEITRNKKLLVECSQQENTELFTETIIRQINILTDLILIQNDMFNLSNIPYEALNALEEEYRNYVNFFNNNIDNSPESLSTMKQITDQCEEIFKKRRKN